MRGFWGYSQYKPLNKYYTLMNRKYVLTDDCITVDGRQLHRIECARFFRSLYPEAPGGYIEHEGNLSHDGDAWVADDAMVMGDAVVEDDALVGDNACVHGEARISGNALIYGNAIVSDRAIIKDDTEMKGHAQVSGNAQVYGKAWISGYAQVDDYAMVYGNAQVSGNARISGDAEVCGGALVTGNAEVSETAEVFGNAFLYGAARIGDEARVNGNAHICGDALVSRSSDYLYIGNLYPKWVGNGECYSVTAFVTRDKTIGVVHVPSLTSFHFPSATIIEEYEAEVKKTYGITDYKEQYQAVVSLIKAWSKLHSNEISRLVIAIGNGGCNVADSLCEILPSDGRYRFVMLDTDSEQLGKHKAECEKVLLTGNHADDETAITRLLAGDIDEVAVVVCLGGKMGSQLAPLVVRKVSEITSRVKCVAAMPFTFEGERRKARAKAALSELHSCISSLGKVSVIYNDELFEEYADDSICDAFLQIDREVAKAVLS